jgi:DDB1- and CUL4-associated factor 13
MHPFQGAREYKRALNAAKMEKMFAKPFICALDTHNDGVTTMAKSRGNLVDMLTGSADGEVIFWNLPEQRPVYQLNAHSGFVRGVTFASNHSLSADTHFVSTG